MDNDGPITSDQYNKYYENNNTIEGIKEIIKNNQFYINGFTIPGTESEFLNKTPEGYSINKRNWLIHNNEKYQVILITMMMMHSLLLLDLLRV